MISLLEAAYSNVNGKISSIHAVGCNITSPINSTFLDGINNKLVHDVPVRELWFSCAGVDKMDVDCLREIWGNKWGEEGLVVERNGLVKMSLKDGAK